MGYKAGFKFRNQEQLSFNALVFATKEEATTYANDLLMKWFVPIGFEIVKTNEKVNYKIEDFRLIRLE